MKKRYEPQLFRSPIDLPEKKVGAFEVRHATVEKETPIVGMRNAMMRGVRQVNAILDEPLRYHQLVENEKNLWMTDLPEELNQIGEAIHSLMPAGRVLVGGLGLGILPLTLARSPRVEQVVVIERSAEVIELTANGDEYEVVHGDLHDYVKTARGFDRAYLDTWQSTSEGEWWETVLPLRRSLTRNGLRPDRIWCWAEDIMLGQVVRALRGPRHWKHAKFPEVMTETDIEYFISKVGAPTWEKRYGSLLS